MISIAISQSDTNGGAARAAYRIHQALLDSGIDSRMWVNHSMSGDWTVEGLKSNLEKIATRARPYLARLLTKTLLTENAITHSPAIFPSKWVNRINKSEADIIHLHWIQGEMLSIPDIAHIKKPVVWTLHDMWAFCGAEHVAWDNRWREGYRHDNRPKHESGFDLNRWTWKRKRKYWKSAIHIVTPSRWLGDCVLNSELMRDWQVSVIPNCVNTERWQPFDPLGARELHGLPQNIPLIMFGSFGDNTSHHKGFDLLRKSLSFLKHKVKDLEIIVFGQIKPRNPPDLGLPLHYVGHFNDEISLRTLYSAADLMVVPSRQDNLPNTAVESHACGTPVVAFNIGGLPDIIDHKTTGYLAHPYDVEDLANGIQWVINNSKEYKLRENARLKAENTFDSKKVADQYLNLYKKILGL